MRAGEVTVGKHFWDEGDGVRCGSEQEATMGTEYLSEGHELKKFYFYNSIRKKPC